MSAANVTINATELIHQRDVIIPSLLARVSTLEG